MRGPRARRPSRSARSGNIAFSWSVLLQRESGTAPQLLEPPVAAAAVAVVLVADRVLQIVVLVVFLGRIEGRGRNDGGRDRRLEGAILLERRPRALGHLALRRVVIEQRRAIGAAAVAELPAGVGRIDVVAREVVEPRRHRIAADGVGPVVALLVGGIDHPLRIGQRDEEHVFARIANAVHVVVGKVYGFVMRVVFFKVVVSKEKQLRRRGATEIQI